MNELGKIEEVFITESEQSEYADLVPVLEQVEAKQKWVVTSIEEDGE